MVAPGWISMPVMNRANCDNARGTKGTRFLLRPVREPVKEERMEPGVGKDDLDPARGCRVHGERRVKVSFYFLKGLAHIFNLVLWISNWE